MSMKKDYIIIRELAKQLAEIAAQPINEERRKLWCKLNALKPERPMYLIDELPWHELNVDGELTLQCQDETCKMIENDLRRQLYRYKYVRDDYVYEPVVYVQKVIRGIEESNALTGVPFNYGISIKDDVVSTDPNNLVVAHSYHDQLVSEEDLEKLRCPDICLDDDETKKREEIANEALSDILTVRMDGFTPWYCGWDMVVMWRGVENVIYGFVDEPEFMHKLIRKVLDITLQALDKLEEQGLLSWPQRTIHCAGAWTDILPQSSYAEGKSRARDLWTYGMAQILYMLSPEKHNEYEFSYAREWYSRFGFGYYGCCEPLDDRLEYVKKIPNLRKISASAWVKDYDRFSESLEGKYVMVIKPSPSCLLDGGWNRELIENNLRSLLESAKKYNNACEFNLKDISTVNHHPERIGEWSDIMRKLVGG